MFRASSEFKRTLDCARDEREFEKRACRAVDFPQRRFAQMSTSTANFESVVRRRRFLTQSGVILAAGATGHLLLADETPGKPEDKKDEKPGEEVLPPEDLMREHGVLKRILLIYGEALRRMDAREDLPPEPIQ